jgi:hypothetical protein
MPESAETAAVPSQAARSYARDRQLQREDLELPGELYLTTQVESSTRMSLRKSSFIVSFPLHSRV